MGASIGDVLRRRVGTVGTDHRDPGPVGPPRVIVHIVRWFTNVS